jgi:hypothetical protein
MAMDIHLTQACREREREMPILIRESKSGTLYWDTQALNNELQLPDKNSCSWPWIFILRRRVEREKEKCQY